VETRTSAPAAAAKKARRKVRATCIGLPSWYPRDAPAPPFSSLTLLRAANPNVEKRAREITGATSARSAAKTRRQRVSARPLVATTNLSVFLRHPPRTALMSAERLNSAFCREDRVLCPHGIRRPHAPDEKLRLPRPSLSCGRRSPARRASFCASSHPYTPPRPSHQLAKAQRTSSRSTPLLASSAAPFPLLAAASARPMPTGWRESASRWNGKRPCVLIRG
jgi:hypothetical protein